MLELLGSPSAFSNLLCYPFVSNSDPHKKCWIYIIFDTPVLSYLHICLCKNTIHRWRWFSLNFTVISLDGRSHAWSNYYHWLYLSSQLEEFSNILCSVNVRWLVLWTVSYRYSIPYRDISHQSTKFNMFMGAPTLRRVSISLRVSLNVTIINLTFNCVYFCLLDYWADY